MSRSKTGQLAVDLSNKDAALLKRLQSEDDQIQELLCHASHTALYKYNPPEKTWQRLGVEGPLVIVRRSIAPSIQMIILNRLSRDNYVIDTSSIIRTKSQDPYLMLQLMRGAGSKLVLGCWFYGNEEREQVRQVLDAVLEEGDKTALTSIASISAAKPSSHVATPSASTSTSTAPMTGGDRASGQQILQLLRKDGGKRNPSPITTKNGLESKKPANKTAAAASSPVQSSPDDLLTPSEVLGVPSKFARQALASEAGGYLNKDQLRQSLRSLSNDDLFVDALYRRLHQTS